ncbi:kelch repeat-containing protein [Pontibacter liquoris]|uniref:kelch repeat-containing protein n=1 Tax=Pontibacter liquoris TaxID=2905677 RepID=UPI001FA7AC61|nr:kelch repeat-containing protein [Pontibacter liquoris]
MSKYFYPILSKSYFYRFKRILLSFFFIGIFLQLYAAAEKMRPTGTAADDTFAEISASKKPASATDFSGIVWQTAAGQPYAVSEAQGEVVKGKLYSFGGFDSQKSGFTPTNRAYVYDPATDKWTALAPMPPMNGTRYGGVTHAGFATDGTDIYFAGGYTANAAGTGQIFGTKEVWSYRVAQNKYERLPDLPITIAAGQLEYENGKLHHISGTNTARTQDMGDHYVLDLKNTGAGWKTLAPLPQPRQHAGSAVLDGKIYFIGGQTGHDEKLVTRKLVHRYDPATNTWTQVADLPAPAGTNGRGHISSSVVVADNRLVVLGGETSHSKQTNMVSAYSPATNQWENLTPLPENRFSGVAGYIGQTFYYTGGSKTSTTFKGMADTPINPTGQQATGYLVVENQDKFPAPDHLAFSLVQVPWHRPNTPLNENHNKVKLKISNKGTAPLTVNSLVISNTSTWRISKMNDTDYTPSAFPRTLAANASVMLTLEFIARDQGERVKILHETLTIASDDQLEPAKKVYLHGLWQREGEDVHEPWVQEIINAFGFQTATGYHHDDNGIKGEGIVPNSDEVLSSFFVRVDPSRPVEVIQMSAYHGCCNDRENFEWYPKGGTPVSLFTHSNLDGQSILPRNQSNLSKLAQGTFSPNGAFGFRVGTAYSDRTRNSKGKIGMRIWKAIDAAGNLIPNAYIVGGDYLGNDYTNYDYQDNVYFVRNVRPENGTANVSELVPTPSAVYFEPTWAGANKQFTVSLKNEGKTYEDGSSDPAITIRSIELVGPDIKEFTMEKPGATQLAVQAAVSLKVAFRPASRGIKNAALLVHHSSSDAPLRIPLYGIANDKQFVVTPLKRIKGGSDTNIVIDGEEWETDKNYRRGSIKLDAQVVKTPVAATDKDVLYQTYLSAAAELGVTSYKIPIENGNYMVRMHFVENYWSAEAARIFNVTMENALRLANFDIYKEVGYRTALVKDFNVAVADGNLDIVFNPTMNRVALAGLEIFTDSANVTGVPEEVEEEKRQVQVFPNPTQGKEVQVLIQHFNPQEEATIILHDVLGRIIYTKKAVTSETGNASAVLGIAPSEKGLYLVTVEAPSGKAQCKLLVQ